MLSRYWDEALCHSGIETSWWLHLVIVGVYCLKVIRVRLLTSKCEAKHAALSPVFISYVLYLVSNFSVFTMLNHGMPAEKSDLCSENAWGLGCTFPPEKLSLCVDSEITLPVKTGHCKA